MKPHRSLLAGNTRALIVSLVATAILSLFPIASYATIDWTEGFEYASFNSMIVQGGGPWDSSCSTDGNILFPSTDRAFSGSKSLKMIYRGHQTNSTGPATAGYKSCFMTRPVASPGETVYARWYMYLDNFTIDPNAGTKVTRFESQGLYPGMWWIFKFGVAKLSVSVEGIILDNGAQGTQDIYGGGVPQNQWVCVETQLTMSTPGVDNGIVRQWINGAQTINKTNQRMRAATLTLRNSPTAKFTHIKLYVQDGIGTIYVDHYAVSRDARIGCSGSTPAGDTTAPKIPTGVTAK